MGNKCNLLSNSPHNVITKNDGVYLDIYDILRWNIKKRSSTGILARPAAGCDDGAAARVRYRREEIKHGINVVLQMTPPLMPLQ